MAYGAPRGGGEPGCQDGRDEEPARAPSRQLETYVCMYIYIYIYIYIYVYVVPWSEFPIVPS